MNIATVHEQIEFAIKKNRGGYVDPEEIDIALDRAQMIEFETLTGNLREYQSGRPLPRISYGVTRKVHRDLQPFKSTFSVTASDYNQSTAPEGSGPTGIIVLPDDSMYITALFTTENEFIEILTEDELARTLNSEIVAPTATVPNAILGGKGGVVNGQDIGDRYKIQLFPEQGIACRLHYLRRPLAPKFAYTLDSDNRKVIQDVGNSVDLEWNEGAAQRIIVLAIRELGYYLEDNTVIQQNEMKQQTGA